MPIAADQPSSAPRAEKTARQRRDVHLSAHAKRKHQTAANAAGRAAKTLAVAFAAIGEPSRNRLLAGLAPAEYRRLLPGLQPVRVKRGAALYHVGDPIRDCYFPLEGIVSVLSIARAGEVMEVVMTGREGVVGVAALLQVETAPFEIRALTDCRLLKIKTVRLKKEFARGGALQALLLRYLYALLRQIAQSAVCNNLHSVKQRLCRWLLAACDKTECERFPLTQEQIALMLGTPRTNVTKTLAALAGAGLLDYQRGRISILRRAALEQTACECYRIIKDEIGAD